MIARLKQPRNDFFSVKLQFNRGAAFCAARSSRLDFRTCTEHTLPVFGTVGTLWLFLSLLLSDSHDEGSYIWCKFK